MLAAKQGATAGAEQVIRDMKAAGLQPGPRAYHGLVFAYVKVGEAEAALDAMRSAAEAGVQPIPESYTLLIHAFMQQDAVEEAQLLLRSMERAYAADAKAGWLMLTQVCPVPQLYAGLRLCFALGRPMRAAPEHRSCCRLPLASAALRLRCSMGQGSQ